jgi:GntR family transcriptional regulator, transcriptional repressor for pyruvate dehydrogenase complex
MPADTVARVPSAEPTVTFEPIGRETLSGRIRDQLYQRISTGELQPGARMPSERSLSEQFRVARTSVREAIQGLVSLGVIERRGNRSYVAEHLPDVNVNGTGDDRKAFVRQLFETRRALELPIIELAAERATHDARVEIDTLSRQFRPGMELTAFRRADRQFHAAIARATGNPLLVEMYGKVLARLFGSVEFEDLLTSHQNHAEVTKIVDESAEHHATIAAAIAAGDAGAAVREGGRHLNAVEQGILDRLA